VSTTTSKAWPVIGTALALGLLADLLLRSTPWSAGLVLWLAAALAAPFVLRPEGRAAYALPVLGCLAAAAMMVLRASDDLWVFNLAALLTGLAALLFRARGGAVSAATPEEGMGALVEAAVHCVFGPFLLAARDLDWSGERSTGRRVLVGALLASPILLVLGALLVGAEPVFGAYLRAILDLPHLVVHVLMWAWFGWITAGYLRALILHPEDRWRPGRGPGIGEVESLTVLGAIALLFGAYLAIEVRTLLGGAALVQSVTGMTYARYARQGFFELVVAAGITLAALLAVDWARGRTEGEPDRRVRGVSWVLLVMLGLVIASAFARLALYVSYYGLSSTRVYATMAIAWAAVASAWFGLTVLRGRRGRFVLGALTAAVLWLAAADVANVDALIVRFNLARAESGRPFDAEYLGRLSADAVPVLLAALPQVPPEARCDAVRGVQERADRSWGYDRDWRTWNLAIARAGRAVQAADLRRNYPACFTTPTPARDDH
jgi:hypothetical protein